MRDGLADHWSRILLLRNRQVNGYGREVGPQDDCCHKIAIVDGIRSALSYARFYADSETRENSLGHDFHPAPVGQPKGGRLNLLGKAFIESRVRLHCVSVASTRIEELMDV
jgi:hypothetical protein